MQDMFSRRVRAAGCVLLFSRRVRASGVYCAGYVCILLKILRTKIKKMPS